MHYEIRHLHIGHIQCSFNLFTNECLSIVIALCTAHDLLPCALPAVLVHCFMYLHYTVYVIVLYRSILYLFVHYMSRVPYSIRQYGIALHNDAMVTLHFPCLILIHIDCMYLNPLHMYTIIPYTTLHLRIHYWLIVCILINPVHMCTMIPYIALHLPYINASLFVSS